MSKSDRIFLLFSLFVTSLGTISELLRDYESVRFAYVTAARCRYSS